mgnify:CR=1 FL=1|tara:strand:+ start:576 stop:737 length:162 start_codon:yes stop_codon:yes gene_type:complete
MSMIENEEIKMDIYSEVHDELWNDEFCTLEGEAFEKEVSRLTELRFLEMGEYS